MTSGIAHINGADLYYELHGSVPAVVLVHGFSFDHRMWAPQLPALPAIDQPKLMKLLFPFIDLGKGVALGKIRCW